MQVQLTCEQCGKTYTKPPSQAQYENGPRRFCNRACYAAWQKGKILNGPTKNVPYDDLIQRYQDGETLDQVAADYGITKQALYYHMKQRGIPRRPPPRNTLSRPEVRQKAKEAHVRGSNHFRYKELPVNEIAAAYQAGVSSALLAKQYGVRDVTILRKLKDAGIKTRRKGFARRRRCPDGHIVDSRWEYEVDRWLSAHGIDHEVHPYVPWYTNGKSPQRADFRVGSVYIEVWGIIGNEKYNAKRQRKIERYRGAGVQLIEIFPQHILDGDYSPLFTLLNTS